MRSDRLDPENADPDKTPEMPDYMIAATAKRLNSLLITRDHAISVSGLVPVVW